MNAAIRLHAWLETMRFDVPGGPRGYGGPVTHWWRDSTRFAGPALDWRYEGIILGYLALHERSGAPHWLELATRAGDDLLAGQLPNGCFRWSGFEQNPISGGTPHEAAADVGLLALSTALKRIGHRGWGAYLDAAAKNVHAVLIGRLWDEEQRRFADSPERRSFVPNKSATIVEVLFQLHDLTAESNVLDRYARPSLDAILSHQVKDPASRLDGAIAQNTLDGRVIEAYFPLYAARCVPALVAGAQRFNEPVYLDAARRAGAFIVRWLYTDGSAPQVVYPAGRVNRYPQWTAGCAELLRALEALLPYGLTTDLERTRKWLLAGQHPHGAMRTAHGFASQVSQRSPGHEPDARDMLPVVGWSDKVFRYLASHAETAVPAQAAADAPLDGVRLPCLWRGQPAHYCENAHEIRIVTQRGLVYSWTKGTIWAAVTRR